ncbi:T9SS type A sorting domain-containing protein [Joostella atrarenae]|uniref:T9SS type A sorting domain-containing protein n=1 Tax=Joostella atrarenae TaxID=679257 RepID=A0ABS9J6X1_9FLAO|nr:T9SS type A sorting domain-containing protein [Joostella atrarenae]MCF8716169.1 T9SS type A sorting domain-containing protein [Joostella atrarenae]
MKKILLLFGFFTLIGLQGVFGQSEYGFLVEVFQRDSNHASFGSVAIGPNFSKTYRGTDISGIGSYEYDVAFVEEEEFTSVRIQILASWVDLDDPISCGFDETLDYSKTDFKNGKVEIFGACDFIIKLYPLHIKKENDKPICTKDEISLSYGYEWEYSFDAINWNSFPENLNINKPIFNLEELFMETGLNERDWKNEDVIYFHTGYQDTYTNERTYTIIGCSPELDNSKTTTTNTTCSDSSDGTVTFTFMDELDDGYKMRFYVYDLNQRVFFDDGANLKNTELFESSGENGFPEVLKNYEVSTFNSSNQVIIPDLSSSIESTGNSQDYFVVYQSIQGEGDNVVVKSGEISDKFTIKSPSPVTTTSSNYIEPVCVDSKGSIVISASSGKDFDGGKYWFSEDGGNTWLAPTPPTSNTYKFTDLVQGSTYSFTSKLVLDNGRECESLDFIEQKIEKVVNPLKFQTTAYNILKHPTYEGATNGIVQVGVSGIPPFEYQLLDENNEVVYSENSNSISYTFNNVAAGKYNIRVLNNGNQCSVNIAIVEELKSPPQITIDKEYVTPISCSNGNDGSLTVEVKDGYINNTSDYRYEWTKNGVLYPGDSNTIVNLESGEYTVTVFDKNDPPNEFTQVTATWDLSDPAPITFNNVEVSHITCNGAADGLVRIEVSGGNGDFAYKFGRMNNFKKFSAKGISVLEIPIDSFVYEASLEIASVTDWENDIFNCGVTYSELITVDEPIKLSINENITDHIDNNIFGGAIGALKVEADGGTGNYSYEWKKDGNDYIGTENTLTSLSAGSYQVTVTDENGCTAELSSPIIITQPDELLIPDTNINVVDVECNGFSTGSIAVTPVGGIAPYHYKWEKVGDPNFISGDIENISNLTVGSYVVTVTDESGSDASYTSNPIEVKEPEALQLTSIVGDNLCYSDTQGSIDITVAGGTGSYTYTWSNGASTEDITGLSSGDYTVTVTDENGCELIETINVEQPNGAISLTIDEHRDITGFGYDDGAISVTITGGTPLYTYEWFSDTGFSSTDEDINGLEPGTYTLVVNDANSDEVGSINCSIIKDFVIVEPEKLEINIEETFSLLCKGDSYGELQANASGGIKPYSYIWYEIIGGTSEELSVNESTIVDLTAGDYQLQLTDANGVKVLSEVYSLLEPNLLEIKLESLQDVFCYGDSTGSISISIAGGTPPYDIYWSNDANSKDLQNLSAGTYTVSVKDDNACWTEATFEISNVYEPINIENVEITNASEFRASDGKISLDIVGGATPYDIQWTRLEDGKDMGSTTRIDNLIKGNYELMITDVNGCGLTEKYEVTEPDIVEEIIVNPTCFDGCNGSISIIVNKGSGNFQYVWDNGSTSKTISNLCAGKYTVSIEGFNNETLVRTYEVINPEPLIVDLGDDLTTLCNDQTRTIDATIADNNATYQWSSTNGFTSSDATITVGSAGIYTVVVTDSKGCQGTDTIEIKESGNDIGVEFFVSSQVFVNERFTVVDVTNPIPDTIEWILPEQTKVVSKDQDQAELYFDEVGEYELTMLTTVGDCQAYQTKTVNVIARDNTSTDQEDGKEREANIEKFMVYPNPTSGVFDVSLELKEKGDVSVKVFNLLNNSVVASKKGTGDSAYILNFNISSFSSGIYAIVLETPNGIAVRKLIKG